MLAFQIIVAYYSPLLSHSQTAEVGGWQSLQFLRWGFLWPKKKLMNLHPGNLTVRPWKNDGLKEPSLSLWGPRYVFSSELLKFQGVQLLILQIYPWVTKRSPKPDPKLTDLPIQNSRVLGDDLPFKQLWLGNSHIALGCCIPSPKKTHTCLASNLMRKFINIDFFSRVLVEVGWWVLPMLSHPWHPTRRDSLPF